MQYPNKSSRIYPKGLVSAGPGPPCWVSATPSLSEPQMGSAHPDLVALCPKNSNSSRMGWEHPGLQPLALQDSQSQITKLLWSHFRIYLHVWMISVLPLTHPKGNIPNFQAGGVLDRGNVEYQFVPVCPVSSEILTPSAGRCAPD